MMPERDMIPFFGCLPHTPDRAFPELARLPGAKGRANTPCRTCGGQPEGSLFVCMGCHAVAPSIQERFDVARVEAARTREPERNLMRRAAYDKMGSRSILTADERANLIAEYPELAPTWLDSIGQPAGKPEPEPEPVAA